MKKILMDGQGGESTECGELEDMHKGRQIPYAMPYFDNKFMTHESHGLACWTDVRLNSVQVKIVLFFANVNVADCCIIITVCSGGISSYNFLFQKNLLITSKQRNPMA